MSVHNLERALNSGAIMFTNDGAYGIDLSLRPLGDCSKAIDKIASTRSFKIPFLSSIECPGETNMLQSMSVKTDQNGYTWYYVTTRLKYLNFNTSYAVAEEGDEKWLYPSFRNSAGNSSALTFDLKWKPQDALRVYITFELRAEPDNPVAVVRNSFLHARIRDTEGDFRLPVGNVYNNSCICFGEAYIMSGTVLDTVNENIDLFYSTPWNADLSDTIGDKSSKLFRFHADTNEQLEPKGQLSDILEYFSASYIEDLAI